MVNSSSPAENTFSTSSSSNCSSAPQEYDILIAGTGLVHAILASALSWQGLNVLHIDTNPWYGDTSATLSIDELKQWVNKVNNPGNNKNQEVGFFDAQLYMPNKYRISSNSYGIDICPKIMFAQSDMLALLVKSKVHKYLEFQSLSSFHVFENDSFEKLMNNSRLDIFADPSLSLQMKRTLMKFIKFVINLQDNKPTWLPYSDQPIHKFLTENFKLNDTQINEIIFSLALCFSKNLNTLEALQRVRRYLVSFDVYGNFPVIYSKYGGPGELAQGFCRSAAVAGSTYMLNTSIKNIQKDIVTLSDDTQVKVKEQIVVSPTQLNTPTKSVNLDTKGEAKEANTEQQSDVNENEIVEINRLVAVVTKDCSEWFEDNEHAALVIFPENSLPSNNRYAVQVVVMNSGSCIVPSNQAIWYLSTIESGQAGKDDLQEAFKLLENSILRESSNLEEFLPTHNNDINNANLFEVSSSLNNSVRLGANLKNFTPKEKLSYILKLSYTTKTRIPNFSSMPYLQNQYQRSLKYSNVLVSQIPSSELSYDGVITELRALYSAIAGTDDDFFDVDFEDDEDQNDHYKNNTDNSNSENIKENISSSGEKDHVNNATSNSINNHNSSFSSSEKMANSNSSAINHNNRNLDNGTSMLGSNRKSSHSMDDELEVSRGMVEDLAIDSDDEIII